MSSFQVSGQAKPIPTLIRTQLAFLQSASLSYISW